METDFKKLQQLIATGKDENIDLALTLAKSNQIDLKLEDFDALHYWYYGNESKKKFRLDRIKEITNTHFLYCSGMYLQIVSEHVWLFSNLVMANLTSNGLKNIPSSIGRLEQLTQLFLGFNHLTSLPDSIGDLTALTHLNINRNSIESLPDSIGKLKNLVLLDISNNRLKTVPENIQNLKKLKQISVYGNKFTKEENKRLRSLLPNCTIRFG